MLFQRNQMQGTAGCHLHTDGRAHPVSRVNHQVGACKWCTRVVQAPIPVVLQIVGVQLLNINLRYKTACVRPVRYERNHSSAVPEIPILCRSWWRSVLWSMVSKAALRSSRTRMTPCLLSMCVRMSFCTLTKAVSVEWYFLYADCITSWRLWLSMWERSLLATSFSRILDKYDRFDTGL